MIYRPRFTRRLWDTWLFPWKDEFHLFFLETQEQTWDHVGHAVSRDLVHWEDLPSIPTKGKPGTWNHEPTLTGMTVHHEGLFYMFVGAQHNNVQVVGVYTSKDLETWTPHPENPVMKPAAPYYLDRPAPPFFTNVNWRDPCISYRKEDGYYHALVCARLPKVTDDHTGAAVGHLRSKDLIHWEVLPPVATPGETFFHTEVPDIFELEGRYYLAFATHCTGGIRLSTPNRDDAVGTFYMIGDSYEGPFTLPADPLLIGSGNRRFEGYVGRTIPFEGGRLLYHHIAADRSTVGAPKRIQVRKDGGLWAGYMPVLEKLETKIICDSIHSIPHSNINDPGRWVKQDNKLIGRAAVIGSSYTVAGEIADLHFQCRIMSQNAGGAGVVVRNWQNNGLSVLLNFDRQRMEIGSANQHGAYKMGWTCQVHDFSRMALEKGREYHLRCFARDEHFEVYLDDVWVFTSVFGNVPKMGGVDLIVERGEAKFDNLRIAEIEALA
jgi:beta-fructofuranosidase